MRILRFCDSPPQGGGSNYLMCTRALVVQRTERQVPDLKVVGSIPTKGAYMGVHPSASCKRRREALLMV